MWTASPLTSHRYAPRDGTFTRGLPPGPVHPCLSGLETEHVGGRGQDEAHGVQSPRQGLARHGPSRQRTLVVSLLPTPGGCSLPEHIVGEREHQSCPRQRRIETSPPGYLENRVKVDTSLALMNQGLMEWKKIAVSRLDHHRFSSKTYCHRGITILRPWSAESNPSAIKITRCGGTHRSHPSSLQAACGVM